MEMDSHRLIHKNDTYPEDRMEINVRKVRDGMGLDLGMGRCQEGYWKPVYPSPF
jgi:hypothetical protein